VRKNTSSSYQDKYGEAPHWPKPKHFP